MRSPESPVMTQTSPSKHSQRPTSDAPPQRATRSSKPHGRWGSTFGVNADAANFEDFLQSWGGPAVALWGTVLLARIGVLAVPLPRWMLRVGTCVLVVVFALVGANNLIQAPDAYARDWHIYFFGPLLLTLAALCAIAERSTPPR